MQPESRLYNLAFASKLMKKHGKNHTKGSRKVPRYPSGSSTVHIYTQTVHSTTH
jgi:hypothetical protein